VAKFKQGDRVRRIVSGDAGDPHVGALGTVCESGSQCPYVDWDGFTRGHDMGLGDGRISVVSCAESHLELAPSSPAPSADRTVAILIAAGHVTQAQVNAARALLAMEA